MNKLTSALKKERIPKFIASVLLGLISVTDKHFSVCYLSAPSLLFCADRIGLSKTGVLLGQLGSLLSFGEGVRLLPALIGIYLLLWLFRGTGMKGLSPGALGGILCLYEILLYFVTDMAGEDLIPSLCRSVLSGCAAFFVLFLKEKGQAGITEGHRFTARLLSSLFILTLFDSMWLEGLPLQCAALTMVLLSSREPLYRCIPQGLVCTLAAPLGERMELFPLYLAGVVAVAVMKNTDRKKCAAAMLLCCEVTLLPYGIWRLSPVTLFSPPIAVLLFLSFPAPVQRKSMPKKELPGRYDELVQEVDKLQQAAEKKITFHPDIAKRASALLKERGGQEIQVTCAEDILGGFFLDADFRQKEGSLSRNALLGLMERAAGFSLSIRRYYQRDGHINVCFTRRAPYKVQCAALCKTKEGETVCGDTALAFGTDQFHYALLLSDGMGSGKDAFAQSCWTVTLLQKLLRAGIQAEGAMGMVHSTLKLAQQDIAFATADLCTIDLWDGSASFIKAGAVSTFILRGERIIEVFGISMPLGVPEQADMAAFKEKLEENDLILMISDGAYDCKDEALYTLQKHRSLPVKELAQRLMHSILSCSQGSEDDITVLLAKFIQEDSYD